MADFYGALVGTAYANTSATPVRTDHFHEKGEDNVLVRDRIELAGAVVTKTISLGKFPSASYFDPLACMIYHDDLGTSVTLDIGHAAVGSVAADPDAFVNDQDVATAAGSFSLFKSIDIANWFKPLWQTLGMAADPVAEIELIATIAGGTATGTVVWSFQGQAR